MRVRDDILRARAEELRAKLRQALRNERRQRRRELAGLPVRVPSSFWERVALDYVRELDRLPRVL